MLFVTATSASLESLFSVVGLSLSVQRNITGLRLRGKSTS